MLDGYQGKRVIVTGCFSGIGRSVAELLLRHGAEVHGLDIAPCDLPLASFQTLDLRDRNSIESAVQALGGPIHRLFNCAGLAPGRNPLDVMLVNFIGTRYLTDLILPQMPTGSAITSIASNGGAAWQAHLPMLREFTAIRNFDRAAAWFAALGDDAPVAYSFSKEAIIVWTLQAAAEWIKLGVRMNCISPGAVQTPMLDTIEAMIGAPAIDVMADPIGRRSSPEEQAWPMLFLGSDAASYINGVVLTVDGGFLGGKLVNDAGALEAIGKR